MNLVQGSPEWRAHRATALNASDAPAMLGISPYKTRSALLAEKHTGIAPEADDATQRRFNDGHRFEALARPLAESIIKDELSPVTGIEGKYSASFDGITFDGDVIFEHKTLNNDLRGIEHADDLPEQYRAQMEHQLMVSGAQRCLFMATKWDGETLVEKVQCFYVPDTDMRERIIAGWAQFEQDLAAYVPEVATPIVKAEAIAALPSVFVQATGMVTASNLAEFKEAATTFIANIRTELIVDQDFADAEATVKFCKEAEGNIESVKQSITAQMSSVDEVLRTLDHISAQLRDKRLMLDKLVKSEKEARKLELIKAAGDAYAAHIVSLQSEVGGIQLLTIMPRIDFGAAIKGLKSLASTKEKLDTALRDGKFAADQIAKDVRAKLAWCKEHAAGRGALFPDLQQIIVKPFDDFTLLITSRIEAEAKAKAEAEAKAQHVQEIDTSPEPVKKIEESVHIDQSNVVIAHQDEISAFMRSREWGGQKEINHVRAILCEFVKFQESRRMKEAA
ncbi:MAG: YqaJ viral recombinase family protein [Gallionella sp.]|nr:YqaJ viral recombinase family protein [Gallionella sp.]